MDLQNFHFHGISDTEGKKMFHIKQPRNIESRIIVTFGKTVKYMHFNIKCSEQFSYFTDLRPSLQVKTDMTFITRIRQLNKFPLHGL